MKSLHPQTSTRSHRLGLKAFLILVAFLPLCCAVARVGHASPCCDIPASAVSPPGGWLTRVQVEEKLEEAYSKHRDMKSYLSWLKYLANAPYARPRDMMRVGSYYIEKNNLGAAEVWYRRALTEGRGELAVRLDLLGILLSRKNKTETRRELDEIVRHSDFLLTAKAAGLSLTLSQAYQQESQPKSAALAAATAIFQSPEVYANWLAWDALKSEVDALTGNEWITGPPNFLAFRNLLRQGAPHTWPLDAIEKNLVQYEEYIEDLRRSDNASLARFFGERTASFTRFFAMDEARRGHREHSLALHLIAERLAPLSMLSLPIQVTALRDIADIHAHLGHFRHALVSVERLLTLCNGRHWTEEEVCPEQGMVPDLVERGLRAGQSGEQRNYDILEHVINEARAAVSFDQNSGRLRYQDGHDFP